MSATKAGGIKAREANYLRHGKDFYKRIGALGGAKKVKKGFALNPELARKCGRIGGLLSRRTGVRNGEGKRWIAYETSE